MIKRTGIVPGCRDSPPGMEMISAWQLLRLFPLMDMRGGVEQGAKDYRVEVDGVKVEREQSAHNIPPANLVAARHGEQARALDG